MTAPGAADLIRTAGLLADGPVPWGRPVRCSKAGVYVVELPLPADRAPLDLALVGKWLERAPDLLVDGARPSSKELLGRVARDWLPGQTVLLVGSTAGTIAERVAALQATRPGDPLPCSDGLRLHLLRGIERFRLWWAETDAPEEYEDALLDAFAAALDAPTIAALGGFGAPFAVLRRPTGEERPTGITGFLAAAPAAPAPPPTRIVDLPPGAAARQVGAPAPRAVARDGVPVAGSVPGHRSAAPPGRRHRDGPRPHRRQRGRRPRERRPGGSTAAGGRPGEEALHLSPEGLARLEAELHDLRAVRRPEVVRRVATAREHGDLKENAEYHAAREELGFLDGRAKASRRACARPSSWRRPDGGESGDGRVDRRRGDRRRGAHVPPRRDRRVELRGREDLDRVARREGARRRRRRERGRGEDAVGRDPLSGRPGRVGHDGGRGRSAADAAAVTADPEASAEVAQRRPELGVAVIARSPGSGARSWTQTWSAPASRCSRTRAAIAAASPWTTTASRSRSLPPPARSSVGPAEPAQVVARSSRARDSGRRSARAVSRARAGRSSSTAVCSTTRSGSAPRRCRAIAVCSTGNEVRVGAGGPRRRELQHPRPEGREQDGRRLGRRRPGPGRRLHGVEVGASSRSTAARRRRRGRRRTARG